MDWTDWPDGGKKVQVTLGSDERFQSSEVMWRMWDEMEDGKVMMSGKIGSLQFLEGLNSQATIFEFYLLDE